MQSSVIHSRTIIHERDIPLNGLTVNTCPIAILINNVLRLIIFYQQTAATVNHHRIDTTAKACSEGLLIDLSEANSDSSYIEPSVRAASAGLAHEMSHHSDLLTGLASPR